MTRRFPIMGGPSILWSVIEPHEEQARENHDQSLKRLAERGGLDPSEAVAVLEDRKWRRMDDAEALRQLYRWVEEDRRPDYAPTCAALRERIIALEDLVCKSAPLAWVASGDMEGAQEWEKRAAWVLKGSNAAEAKP